MTSYATDQHGRNVYVSRQGDSVDQVAFDFYGRHDGATIAVLRANPGLQRYGRKLPPGLSVVLPDLPPPRTDRRVNLWD